jgi:hypothetical protein
MPQPLSAPTTLDEALAHGLAELRRGVADRRHGLRTVNVASIGTDGGPDVRTMVLRAVDPVARTLRLHSDVRSGKIAQIARDSRVMVHGYDARARLQLRLRGHAAIDRAGAVADAAWAASQPMARLCYAPDIVPGSPIPAAPLPPATEEAGARAHFAVILVRFDMLEWLWLAADGHRRARFVWDQGGDGAAPDQAMWLAP